MAVGNVAFAVCLYIGHLFVSVLEDTAKFYYTRISNQSVNFTKSAEFHCETARKSVYVGPEQGMTEEEAPVKEFEPAKTADIKVESNGLSASLRRRLCAVGSESNSCFIRGVLFDIPRSILVLFGHLLVLFCGIGLLIAANELRLIEHSGPITAFFESRRGWEEKKRMVIFFLNVSGIILIFVGIEYFIALSFS